MNTRIDDQQLRRLKALRRKIQADTREAREDARVEREFRKAHDRCYEVWANWRLAQLQQQ